MLIEKQIMEQHLQETAGDLEFAERELSRRGSSAGTPPRDQADSDDGSPRQHTPSLRQTFADEAAHLKTENERIMEVSCLQYTLGLMIALFPRSLSLHCMVLVQRMPALGNMLRQTFADEAAHLKTENERMMEVSCFGKVLIQCLHCSPCIASSLLRGWQSQAAHA